QEEINKEHEETYKSIDWNAALDHVQSKEPQYIKRYYGMKKKPQTESKARKNMIFYLKNTEDLLLLIPFWAEAVNTACYVQNRVLLTKPHNKTPYELLHGRLPSIGFMRPYGCPVTILNTLDPLGSGPAWLFDIDSLSQTMNYHPKSVSPDIHSSSCGDQTRKQGDKTENKDKGKSPIVTITGFKDLNAEFEECNNNSSNGVNAASSLVSVAGQNYINSTNDFSAAGPSNAAMPNLEDLSHDADDVGAEADINNMESIILVSPIPTTRIHKEHPTSQIINDLSSTTQTRSICKSS
nr:hypothetical protein [Tanacetum cinerariifolium]